MLRTARCNECVAPCIPGIWNKQRLDTCERFTEPRPFKMPLMAGAIDHNVQGVINVLNAFELQVQDTSGYPFFRIIYK